MVDLHNGWRCKNGQSDVDVMVGVCMKDESQTVPRRYTVHAWVYDRSLRTDSTYRRWSTSHALAHFEHMMLALA